MNGVNFEGKDELVLAALYRVILDRKSNPSDSSYTASLMNRGIDTILKKLGEEAVELVIAGKGGDREQITYEAADLIYHLLVLLGFCGIDPAEIFAELSRRSGISGIEEKRSRNK